MSTPTASNHVIPHSTQYNNIQSDWSDVSNWGRLGSRRRIEAVFDKEGNLKTLQLITQNNFGRFLQWAGISHDSGKQFKPLSQDLKSSELWKMVYVEVGGEQCRNILNNGLLPVIKDPEKVEKTVTTLVKEHLNELPRRQEIKSIADKFSKNFNLFDTPYENKINEFASEKIFDFRVGLQNIENEFNDLQNKSFEQCRKDFLEEIYGVIENGIAEDGIETPPFRVRLASLRNLDKNPENQNLLASREKFWGDFRKKLANATDLEDLSVKKNIFLEEQIVDDIIFKALAASNGSAECMQAIQIKAMSMLKNIDPNIEKIESPFEIEDKVKFYQTPKYFNKLSADQKAVLDDLLPYVRCMKFIQKEQLHNEAALFSKNLKNLDPKKGVEWNNYVNDITSNPNLTMEDIQDYFNDKRVDLFEDHRKEIVDGIIHSHSSSPLAQVPKANPEIAALIAAREQQWEYFQKQVECTDNFEILDFVGILLNEEQNMDQILYETLLQGNSEDLGGCLADIQKKMSQALLAADPTIKKLDAPSEILNKANAFLDPKNINQLSEEQKKILSKLFGYVRCMRLMSQVHLQHQKRLAAICKKLNIKPLKEVLNTKTIAPQATRYPQQWDKIVEFISAVEHERQNQINEIFAEDHDEIEDTLTQFAEHQKTLSEVLSSALATPEFLFYDKLVATPSVVVPVMSLGTALDFASRLSESLAPGFEKNKLTNLSLYELKQFVDVLKEEGRSPAEIEQIKILKAYTESITTLINSTLRIIKKRTETLMDQVAKQMSTSEILLTENPADIVELAEMVAGLEVPRTNLEKQSLSDLYKFFVDSLQKLNDTEESFVYKQAQIQQNSISFKTKELRKLETQSSNMLRDLNLMAKGSTGNESSTIELIKAMQMKIEAFQKNIQKNIADIDNLDFEKMTALGIEMDILEDAFQSVLKTIDAQRIIGDKTLAQKKSYISALEEKIALTQTKYKQWLGNAPKGSPLSLLKEVESIDVALSKHADALRLLTADLDRVTFNQLIDLRKKISQSVNIATKNIQGIIKENTQQKEKQ